MHLLFVQMFRCLTNWPKIGGALTVLLLFSSAWFLIRPEHKLELSSINFIQAKSSSWAKFNSAPAQCLVSCSCQAHTRLSTALSSSALHSLLMRATMGLTIKKENPARRILFIYSGYKTCTFKTNLDPYNLVALH